MEEVAWEPEENYTIIQKYYARSYLPRLAAFMKSKGSKLGITRITPNARAWEKVLERLKQTGLDMDGRNKWCWDFKFGYQVWDGVGEDMKK